MPVNPRLIELIVSLRRIGLAPEKVKEAVYGCAMTILTETLPLKNPVMPAHFWTTAAQMTEAAFAEVEPKTIKVVNILEADTFLSEDQRNRIKAIIAEGNHAS